MNLVLRAARLEDIDLLFAWVNRPDSLAAKLRTKGPVGRVEHEVWFRKRLADPRCRIWIALIDEVPIGQVRFTRSAEAWEIDIYVIAERRGGGLGRAVLIRSIALLGSEHTGERVLARVKYANTASLRLFERAGFSIAAEANDHVVLTANLVEGS